VIVIPAIDLKGGKCVRLLQGRKEDVTVYSDDPVATALKWESCGAKVLHIVDLDGAFSGIQANIEAVKAIRRAVKMDIELGGGIRDMGRIDLLIDLGISRVILGTVAVENPELVKEACKRHPGRIFVGIDAKDGMAAVRGWLEVSHVRAERLACRMRDYGVAGIVYTDISKDGMMTGPNIKAVEQMVKVVDIPVIASGGVSRMSDLFELNRIQGLWGVIIGKALYSGAIDLREALRWATTTL